MPCESIVSRALVERYLRATGWTSKYYASGATYYERGQSSIRSGRDDATFIADVRGVLGDDVLLRVALCVAAEIVRPSDENDEVDPLVKGALLSRFWSVLDAAGVEPELWEGSRNAS